MMKLNLMETEPRKLPGTKLVLGMTTCSPPSLMGHMFSFFLLPFSFIMLCRSFIAFTSTCTWVLLLYKFDLAHHGLFSFHQFYSLSLFFSSEREREREGFRLLFKSMNKCTYNQSTLLHLHGYYFSSITNIFLLNQYNNFSYHYLPPIPNPFCIPFREFPLLS